MLCTQNRVTKKDSPFTPSPVSPFSSGHFLTTTTPVRLFSNHLLSSIFRAMSLCEVDMVKIEKEKAMLRYRHFKKIANIARTLEFCFAVLFFSWSVSNSSAYFHAAVDLCGLFLRRLCLLVVSHHFVFLLGNLIIVTLFVKSGYSACNNRNADGGGGNADDDEDYLIRHFVPPHEMVSCGIAPEEAVVDEKHVILTETEVPSPAAADSEGSAVERMKQENPAPRRSRRTRSEEFEPEVTEKIQLRRSETEPRRKIDSSSEESTEKKRMQVEDLSNEEFQRKVEAFIERQQRFLREESLSMVTRHRCSV